MKKAKRSESEFRSCMDPSWRKSRIVARILLRKKAGKLTVRDYRLARKLGRDPDVENRLIDQAFAWFSADRDA